MKSEWGRRIVVRSCRSDRLFRTAPSRQSGLRASARLRRAVPAPTGRTGRRSAIQAVPAILRDWRYAVPRSSGVRGSRTCAPPCPPGYAPRKEPFRRLGSTPPRPCGPLCRPEVGVPLPASRESKRRHVVSTASGGRCRSETGAPALAPRSSGVRGSRACAPPCPPGYAPRKEPSRRLGSTPPRPCGPLCRPEVGVPLPASRESKRRYVVSTASGGRCRSETGAPALAPRGSGVRGSRACAPPCPPGYAPRKEPSRRSGSTPPRPCGPLCRPPPGELARGRRSLACVP